MKIINSNNIEEIDGPVVATIGFFDGVHKGHKFLIDMVRKNAEQRQMKSAVVTFPVHPRVVMNSDYKPVMLSTLDEKLQLLGECGLDYTMLVDFTIETAALTARQFMEEVLLKRLKVKVLVIGYDHRFGHNREEGFEDYCSYGKELGITVIKAESLEAGRYEISSSSIRKYLLAGEIRKATFSLGREYNITGRVVGGYQVGRKIGFPTANIEAAHDKLIPVNGVYAVRVTVHGKQYKGMLNIGNRPTVGNEGGRSTEVHIFNFNETIYDEIVTLTFTEHIRNEQKFESLEKLIEQLRKDEKYIRTLYFINENEGGNVREIALKASANKKLDSTFAASQIEGRSIARNKVPSWAEIDGIIYPKHLSLEQCSSEESARFKATLVKGKTMVDLTGGMGVDFYFLSEHFTKATYVERQNELCQLMQHNSGLLNMQNIEIVNSDSIDYLKNMDRVDFIFIDPARRDSNGGKTVKIEQCEPDITSVNRLLLEKAERVMVKLSPMLDISQTLKDIEGIEKIFVISVANECKEILLMLTSTTHNDVETVCINLNNREQSSFTFTAQQEADADVKYAENPLEYLYEPNTSILKAGAYRILAQRTNTEKLAPNSHLYTSKQLITDFPGRSFEVIQTYDFSKKSLKTLLNECPKANITVRNFPEKVSDLRKKLKIAEGGDNYLFATTLKDKSKVIIRCKKA